MAKNKGIMVEIDKEKVVYVSISKSKDGYNVARIYVKIKDGEYLSVNYEWEGDGVPGFAMDLMGFMQENAEILEKNKEEFSKYKEKHPEKFE